MKKILLFTTVFFIFLNLNAQMVLVYNTDLSDGTIITLPLNGAVNVTVDWGDGSTETFNAKGNIDHEYTTNGTYNVSLSGTLTQFGNTNLGYENGDKLIEVKSFGEIGLTSLDGAFFEAINLTKVPDSIPTTITNLSWMFVGANKFNQDISNWDISHVTDISSMFYYATSFNQDIGNWDVSNVTDMGGLFFGAFAFNHYIGDWDVGNVTNMVGLFTAAESFNQDISDWDVSKVTRMTGMFKQALVFNQDIGSWDVSNVTRMDQMFDNAPLFNQDIGDWDVSKVTNMNNMFSGRFNQPNIFNQDISRWNISSVTETQLMFSNNENFNQDIGSWDVGQVTHMANMFNEAISFNQDISSWDVSNVTSMQNMFKGVKLSTAYYNNILQKWPTKGLSQDVVFNVGDSEYSPGTAAQARQSIIDNYNWSITDGGESDKAALITLSISDLNSINTASGGNISEDGGSAITQRGIVWNTSSNPTISTHLGMTDEGTGIGIFNSNFTNIAPGAIYYVRAYATNGNGTDYGNNIEFVILPELTLSGTLAADNKVYDGTIFASQVSSTLNLDSLVFGYENVVLSDVQLTFDNKNVGADKTVSISSALITGSDASKYKLSLAGSPTALANISAKELTVSGAIVNDKTYDGSIDAVVSDASIDGVIVGDTIEIDTQTGQFDDKNVGTDKPVTAEITIKGLYASNYEVVQPIELSADIFSRDMYIGGNFTVEDKVFDGTKDAVIADNNLELLEIIEEDDVELKNIVVNFEQSDIANEVPVVIVSAELQGSDNTNYNLLLDNAPTTTASITTNVDVEISKVLKCNIYPNPFNECIYLTGFEDNIKVTLTNSIGQILWVKDFTNENKINTNCIKKGIYFLTIESEGYNTKVLKVVKQ